MKYKTCRTGFVLTSELLSVVNWVYKRKEREFRQFLASPQSGVSTFKFKFNVFFLEKVNRHILYYVRVLFSLHIIKRWTEAKV